MKKAIIAFLLVGLALFGIYGCAKVADTGGGGGGGSSTIGAITGTVNFINASSSSITATITITGVTSTAATNQSGWFALGNIPATRNAVMTITATNFVTLRTTLEVVGGQTRHSNYSLAPANAAVTGLAATATQTVPLQGNPAGTITSTVTIPANSLVTSTGAAYTGTYSVALTPGDSSNTDEVDALFPGQFVATSIASGDVNLLSFGFANFGVTDNSGNPINLQSTDSHKLSLAAGATAQWKQEIPASQVASAPSTIDMWYYDETASKWMQGRDASGNPLVGTKVAEGGKSYYVGDINHFSTWNYDVSRMPAFISGRVVNSSGEAIEGAEVKCWSTGWTFRRWRSGETGTNSLGQFIQIAVNPEETFNVQAIKGSQKSAIYSFGPYARNSVTDIGDLVIAGGSTANIQMILTWGAVPSDLDSHMTVPTTTGITTRGHVYFSAKGSPTAYPYCWLDVDDTSSYGPEVTTVTRKLPGTYRFAIHNWSGQSSGPIEASGAKVEGFISGNYYVWNVPTTNSGNKNVWRICDLIIDASGNVSVSTLNDFASSSDTDAYNPVGATGVPSITELQALDKAKK